MASAPPPNKDKEAGSDGRFFQTTKKGEIHELKSDLNSFNKDKIKDAVKKVIAAMTVGKDVSTLFTDVVKSMQTDNIELKKLIYLYIINYARSQPDKAILVVNTFQKDASDKSPLVRALAIRTMGCIRVDRITEYLCEPLSKALKDKDPYVRKTAAVCVAKLYDINAELVEEQGFLELLREMISDPNPMVVANAVASLAEIAETSHKDVFQMNASMLGKLLAALNECTEWGQVFILDCLSRYEPSAKDAEDIIERVSPRLKHVNSAVAMSAVKVIMKYLKFIDNPALEKRLITEKLPPPLITLLSEHKPEIQYVALRNINLIVQKKPDILANGVKHFFCKYNDPIYVKMEKLEIMIKLANASNIEKVLMEFKEYATEVDVEFVRKSVLAIGRCAIKLDTAAERCIKVLLELIQTKVNYVVQEAIIVIKDIFRKYPNRYEIIIATLCENLESLDEPEAKASMIWIIGEYADRIDNAPELLDSFVETFDDESAPVQLQLLTAVVKLFLKRPEDGKEMVQKVLNKATEHSDNPDLRDRGYVYWRLLSTDPEAAQAVVLAAKPVISDDTFQLDHSVLDVLISNISTLASIYHKPPELFLKDGKPSIVLKQRGEKKTKDKGEEEESGSESEEDGEKGDDHGASEGQGGGDEEDAEGSGGEEEEDRHEKKSDHHKALGGGGGGGGILDLTALEALTISTPAASSSSSLLGAAPKVVLPASQGSGLQISVGYSRSGGKLNMDFTFENQSSQLLTQFAVRFNTNYLGLSNAAPCKVDPVAPGGRGSCSLPLIDDKPAGNAAGLVQMAIKTDLGVSYFTAKLPAHLLFTENGRLEKQEFLEKWATIADDKETTREVPGRTAADVEAVKSRFEKNNIFYIAHRAVPQRGDVIYFSLSFKGVAMLVEVTIKDSSTQLCVKSEKAELSGMALTSISDLLTWSA